MKHPQGLTLVKFLEGFDLDMTFQFRERDTETLKEMKKAAISAKVNLIEMRSRMRSEKRVTYKDETMPSTSLSDTNMDSLMRTMERMLERIKLNERTPPRENQANSQNRNRAQNFRRDTSQIKQRENNQQIRPPFQQNCVDEEEGEIIEPEESHINLIGSDNEDDVFLTKEEQGFFSSDQTDTNHEDFEDYCLGFENSIMEVHRQYFLRRKKNLDTPKKS